jgi:excisionase family DNA binding protein
MTGSDKKSNEEQPRADELITLPEAAKLSGLSHSHLRKLVRTGEIWGKRFGQTWVTTEKAVRAYLARNRRPGPKT